MSWKRYFLGILIATTFLVSCGKRTNWAENFRENSKTPFGLYILYTESKELFKDGGVTLLESNILDYLNNSYFDEDIRFNYLCIKDDARKITQKGINKLLSHIEEGSTAFFSLNSFTPELEESLGVETKSLDSLIWVFGSNAIPYLKGLNGELKLNSKVYQDKSYSYDRNLRRNYFSKYNENNTVVLGTQKILDKDEPMFLKVYYGKGVVYLHTQPSVFTNYNLLKDNAEYAEKALSYIPNGEILWDPQVQWSYQDQDQADNDSESALNFFLRNPSLKWFLYVAFIGLLIFLLFNARRKQRAIPVIDPPKNSTLEFTHTISNLYLLNEDHKNMVDKKTQYFLEKIRSRYYLDTSNLNQEFIEKLALKSGNTLADTKALIEYILLLNEKTHCYAPTLLRLSKMIDKFLKQK
jgi:hypothetical protein